MTLRRRSHTPSVVRKWYHSDCPDGEREINSGRHTDGTAPWRYMEDQRLHDFTVWYEYFTLRYACAKNAIGISNISLPNVFHSSNNTPVNVTNKLAYVQNLEVFILFLFLLAIHTHRCFTYFCPFFARLLPTDSLVSVKQLSKLLNSSSCYYSRSQWPRSLRHELFSPAPTLRSWVRIPHRHGCLCVFCVLFFCFYSLKWDSQPT
jgi:hypothetical protein